MDRAASRVSVEPDGHGFADERAMQRFFILGPGVFLCLSMLTTAPRQFRVCLPPGIESSDVVSAQLVKSKMTIKKITVEQRLIELDARCENGKLSAAGKEIYFYRLKGCWGNPPADYQEILQRQNEELEKLRKRYTVVEMTCNPEGLLLH
jgi:hypothetical protein